MSISGISSSNFFQSLYGQNTQRAQFAQHFQQLGQDLQSGNLAQAQSDFATLTANSPFAQQAIQTAASPNTPTNTAPSTNSNASPIAQAFAQLSQDLQAGNLTAAQSDFANIQQDFQQQAAAVGNHPHHHHHHGPGYSTSNNQNLTASPTGSTAADTATSANPGGAAGPRTSAATGSTNSLDQTILQLSQALQAGNLATAQQSYTSLLQEFQQSGVLGANATPASNSFAGSLVSATSATQLLNLTV